MSLISRTSHRRALTIAALTGALLTTGALATATAAQADDSPTSNGKKSTPSDDALTDFPITIADAADKAESKYPSCETTAALLYDTASTPVWDVELTCDSGTVKYVTVNAEDGKVTTGNSGGSSTDTDSSSTTDDDTGDDWWSNLDKDDSPDTDKPADKPKKSTDTDKSKSDTNDAPGTGANTDYDS